MGQLSQRCSSKLMSKLTPIDSLDDHEKWMSGGGIRQWAKQRKRSYLEGQEAVIGRAMRSRRKAVTNYCRLREGKGIGRWWDEKIERVEDAGCPRCGEEEDTPEYIVFRCWNIRMVKGENGRREWGRKEGMR